MSDTTDKQRMAWAERIAQAQLEPTVNIDGKWFDRVKYGDDFPDAAPTCRDCAVEHGQYHVIDCCVERCARCHIGQAICCECDEARH